MVAKMEDKNLVQISLPVQGMTCAACGAKVERSLRSISGVNEVNVNLLSSKVVLSYDKDKTSAPQIVKTMINQSIKFMRNSQLIHSKIELIRYTLRHKDKVDLKMLLSEFKEEK
ncbi:cation transporter [Desulfosporosinus sp. BG]|uniref:cation transporter n=1 Tax=Desulfosporosinus sp. BG TaxID=1633135 RepID=UPI00083B3D82|nr:cation transporter [Desulfosporosinus sp. BG]ODA40919.1 hypothetical protein DSBG_2360 [Desulfosporosinus sp. BG]